MKKNLIGLAIFLMLTSLTFVSAMDVGECYIIESGDLAGRTVCFLGTVTVTAGETVEADLTIEEPTVETLTEEEPNWAWGLYKNKKA